VQRTFPVVLDVDSDDAALLEDTVDTLLWAAQYVVDHAFQGEYVTTSKTTLDDETYDDVREKTDGFNSGLVQAGGTKRLSLQECRRPLETGQKSVKPTFTSPHVVYDNCTATFHDDYMSLATTNGRVEAGYVLPDGDSDTPHSKYLLSDEFETTVAELHYRDDNWVLRIHCKMKVESDTPEQATTENGTVLGADLGVNTLAVTSTSTFWTGDEFDHWRREYQKRRGSL
jgi:putative transposase